MADAAIALMEKMYEQIQQGFEKANRDLLQGLDKMNQEMLLRIDEVNWEMKQRFDGVNQRFDKVESQLKQNTDSIMDLARRVTKIETKIENSLEPKINMCLEEIAGVKEKLAQHDGRYDAIDVKLQLHEDEINVMKSVS